MVVDCSGWIDPLNLSCNLINTFAGTMELFMIIAFMTIAAIGTKFRMMNTTILLMFGLFTILTANFFTGYYFLAVLIGGLVAAFGIGRLAKI